ncbi:MAG: DUF4912 domain-containing protein [Bacillota bacterium]
MQDSLDEVIQAKGSAEAPIVPEQKHASTNDAEIELSPPELSHQPFPHRPFPEVAVFEPEGIQMDPARRRELPILPSLYGTTRIVLQVRDPFWMHAYWEIAEDMAISLRRQLGEELDRSNLTLRIHDVTGIAFDGHNSVGSFDKQVHPFANNWYLNVSESDRSYCVDLGLLTSTSQFHLIARSNTVHTPRVSPSPIVDEEWLTIREIEMLCRPSMSPSSPGIHEAALAEEYIRQVALGSGGVGAVGSPMGGPSEAYQPRRHFWLRADAELIVHGSTEAGARVEICGMPMPVGPDGSFSVRLTLPFGDHPVDILATSADRIMQRGISWTVSRAAREDRRS